MRTSDWVEEREGTLGEPIEFAAEGLALRLSPRRVLRARWEQVLGVAALPPERLLVLLPREPPAPPWIALELDALPPSLRERGIEGLAATIRERSQQIGYRAAPARPRLDEATLLERVIARQAVPGALEVPVGAGPRAPATVAFERVADGRRGGALGALPRRARRRAAPRVGGRGDGARRDHAARARRTTSASPRRACLGLGAGRLRRGIAHRATGVRVVADRRVRDRWRGLVHHGAFLFFGAFVIPLVVMSFHAWRRTRDEGDVRAF